MNPVKAKCKHCGKDAASDQFRLHYQLRMMVCPACYSGKPTPAQQAAREDIHRDGTKKMNIWRRWPVLSENSSLQILAKYLGQSSSNTLALPANMFSDIILLAANQVIALIVIWKYRR
ncbi:hypothetical protein J4444_03805 [Candidatus Woesearchaeota archaeon]|nr:hypothetical protein [Candidatus Woesearchaeota archaeon]